MSNKEQSSQSVTDVRTIEEFIELARSVYYTNDDRAEVKKNINMLTGSSLVEEKSYQQYA